MDAAQPPNEVSAPHASTSESTLHAALPRWAATAVSTVGLSPAFLSNRRPGEARACHAGTVWVGGSPTGVQLGRLHAIRNAPSAAPLVSLVSLHPAAPVPPASPTTVTSVTNATTTSAQVGCTAQSLQCVPAPSHSAAAIDRLNMLRSSVLLNSECQWFNGCLDQNPKTPKP